MLGAALTDIVGDIDGAVCNKVIICYHAYSHFRNCERTEAHTQRYLYDSHISKNLVASLFTTSYDDTVLSHTSNILLFVKYSTRSQLDTVRHIANTYDTQQIQDNEVKIMYGGTHKSKKPMRSEISSDRMMDIQTDYKKDQ